MSILCAQLPAEAGRLPRLPLTQTVAEGQVLACHGSLADARGHLLWQWQREPYLAASVAALRVTLASVSAAVVLCGHTHREALTPLDDRLIINVGAVSNQVDGDPRARWLLLDECGGNVASAIQARGLMTGRPVELGLISPSKKAHPSQVGFPPQPLAP